MVSPRSRRHVLSALSGVLLGSMAGCAEVARGLDDANATPATPRDTPTPTPMRPTRTPGYKDYHWHGQLFVDIDGVLVDFTQPKYHLNTIESEDAIAFHFHESAHGPNEWSNELEVVTLAHGLNLLPGIGYGQSADGSHEVTVEGTTYRERDDGTTIRITEGTATVDPTRHWVRHDDAFWVQISTGAGSPRPAGHGDAAVGTLLVDVNNHRFGLDLDPDRDLDEASFHTHDDGHPARWYVEGDPPTLAEVFDALDDVSYREEDGVSVLSVAAPERLAGTFRGDEDGTTITIRQRATEIDPSSYPLAHGDIVWVYIHTDQAPDNEH